MAMKLSSGKIAFPIEFDNGDKQNIYFNPNDPNLPIRLQEFQKKVSERIKEIKDIELNAEGKPENMDFMENFQKMQTILCEELDIAFGGEISSIIFKYCSPFAIVNGDYFLMQFINAITPEIEKHIKKANAEVEKKMEKHIAKYSK